MDVYGLQSDARLMRLVSEGSRDAFDELDRRHRAGLRRYVASLLRYGADDVTQQALLRAYGALRDGEEIRSFRNWTWRVATRLALNELRSVAAVELPDVSGVALVPETFQTEATLADLLARIDALPERQRAAIILSAIEGKRVAEIAELLGQKPNATSQLLHKARNSLRVALGIILPLWFVRWVVAPTTASAVGIGGGLVAAPAIKLAVPVALVAVGGLGMGNEIYERAAPARADRTAVAAESPSRDRSKSAATRSDRARTAEPATSDPQASEISSALQRRGDAEGDAPDARPSSDVERKRAGAARSSTEGPLRPVSPADSRGARRDGSRRRDPLRTGRRRAEEGRSSLRAERRAERRLERARRRAARDRGEAGSTETRSRPRIAREERARAETRRRRRSGDGRAERTRSRRENERRGDRVKRARDGSAARARRDSTAEDTTASAATSP